MHHKEFNSINMSISMVDVSFTDIKMKQFRNFLNTKAQVRYFDVEKKYLIALKIAKELSLEGSVKKYNISIKEQKDGIYNISFFMFFTESDSKYIQQAIEKHLNTPVFL